MAGKRSRNKGARGEREFFTLLNRYLPERLRFSRDLSQTRDGGADGYSAHVCIEVKRQEKLSLPAWLTQVRAAADSTQVPVLAYRQNRGDWQILVDMDPVQFATYLRYRNNLLDTEESIRISIEVVESQAQKNPPEL